MKQKIIYALLMLFFGLMFLSDLITASEKNDNGKDLYSNNCQICHGVNGDGKGPAAVAFHPAPTAFAPEFWKKDTKRVITDSIMHGRGKMPAFKLSPEEIQAVIDYMTHTYKK